MKQLVVASNNKGKILEIKELIKNISLLSLKDIGFHAEIAEPYHTFEENAHAKASTIYSFCGKNVFAEDSGLCINALNSLPGVDSAHFSGERDDEKNLQKVIAELHGIEDRRAHYKAVICLIWEGDTYYFAGICNGRISSEMHGAGGFGYDPVFIPDGYSHTFGELPLSVKNKISHRAKAVGGLIDFLKGRL